MGILKSLFGKADMKRVYLAGSEVVLNGDERSQKFMEIQGIDKKTAYTLFDAIELEYKDGKLIKAYDLVDGDRDLRELNEEEIGQPYVEVPVHSIYNLQESDNGNCYLGGEIPEDFYLPKIKLNAPFQYLGKLSRSDEFFQWLPFDLHLAAPIYLEFDRFYLDYSDPIHPKVLDEGKLMEAESSFENLNSDSEIIFQKKYFKGQKSNYFGVEMGENIMGHTGVPSWIQFPDIPSCPISKKTMKFVIQLTSTTGIKTDKSNVISTKDGIQSYLEHLNFYCDGNLFVFFEPESKVACFLIQNT